VYVGQSIRLGRVGGQYLDAVCKTGGVYMVIDFFTKNRVKTALRAGLQFLVNLRLMTSHAPPPSLAKMDGVIVTVVHDEFRGMGLSGVSGSLGAGAVVVDVRGMFEGEYADMRKFHHKTL
ncbi:MAG: hypothetical protein KAT65_00435, partial [Methanophagales archaeon]|nr:hypothetical protein [Methanophagales archaeon]